MRFFDNVKIKSWAFYLLTFTWGLPVAISGLIVAFLFLITGHKPKRFGHCIYFSSKRLKGGFSAGMFIFARKGASKHLMCHEHGHGVQNCIYGLFMPLLVSIPSSTRYHFRNFKKRVLRLSPKTPYEDIWFEAQASKIGEQFKDVEYQP